jgi:hypothetical protein
MYIYLYIFILIQGLLAVGPIRGWASRWITRGGGFTSDAWSSTNEQVVRLLAVGPIRGWASRWITREGGFTSDARFSKNKQETNLLWVRKGLRLPTWNLRALQWKHPCFTSTLVWVRTPQHAHQTLHMHTTDNSREQVVCSDHMYSTDFSSPTHHIGNSHER